MRRRWQQQQKLLFTLNARRINVSVFGDCVLSRRGYWKTHSKLVSPRSEWETTKHSIEGASSLRWKQTEAVVLLLPGTIWPLFVFGWGLCVCFNVCQLMPSSPGSVLRGMLRGEGERAKLCATGFGSWESCFGFCLGNVTPNAEKS